MKKMDLKTLQRVGLMSSGLALAAMLAVACSPRTEEPADTSTTTPSTTLQMAPTQKSVRTNVTREPMSAAPPHGNGAEPCGFGPGGGAACHRHNGGYGGGYGGGNEGGGGESGGGGGD